MEQEERFMIIKTGREHYGIKINDVKEVFPDSDHNLVPIIDTNRLSEKIGVLEETELLPQ